MSTSDTLGLVPARGGSKGIPRKNVKELAGAPLVGHTVTASRRAERIDRTLVSTDDEEIRDVAREYGAEVPFLRPGDLAADETPMEPVVEHAIEFVRDNWEGEWETLVLLQPTSPLRDEADIDAALRTYAETGSDSVVAVFEDHSYRWERTADGARRKNYAGGRKRRQDKRPEFVESGAIYIVDTDSFLDTGDLQAGTTELYVMDRPSAVDIDTDFEFWLAEQIMTEWLTDD